MLSDADNRVEYALLFYNSSFSVSHISSVADEGKRITSSERKKKRVNGAKRAPNHEASCREIQTAEVFPKGPQSETEQPPTQSSAKIHSGFR